MTSLETFMAESLGENFFRFDFDSNRILNVRTGKLMPRVRRGTIEIPIVPISNRTPMADAILVDQMDGVLKIYSVEKIIKVVCTVFGVTKTDILSDGRAKKIATARKMAFYILRENTKLSLPSIARLMHRECHSTVVHGCKYVAQNEPAHKVTISKIRHQLEQGD